MRALRLLLPLALIAACLLLADPRAALARLAGADPLWLAAGIAAVNAVTVLSALRWRMTAAALGLAIPAGRAVREYYLAQFVNQSLPGGMLGDVARAARSRHGAGMRRAAQAVVLERAAGQAAMLTLLSLGTALAALRGLLPPVALATLLLPPALLAAAALLLRRGGAAGWRAAGRTALLARWPAQAGLSLGIALATIAAFAAAARATGTPLGPAPALFLAPLILTAMLLPASVAGWGWREGAAAALFPLAGAPSSAGLAASLAFGLIVLAAALPGALFLHARAAKAPPEVAPGADPPSIPPEWSPS